MIYSQARISQKMSSFILIDGPTVLTRLVWNSLGSAILFLSFPNNSEFFFFSYVSPRLKRMGRLTFLSIALEKRNTSFFYCDGILCVLTKCNVNVSGPANALEAPR